MAKNDAVAHNPSLKVRDGQHLVIHSSDKDGRVAELANRKMAAGQIVLCNAYVAPLVEDLVGSCHLPFTLTTLLESSCLLRRRGSGWQ